MEVVHEAFTLEGGEQCMATLRQGIQDTVTAIQSGNENARRTVEEAYRYVFT